MKLFNKKRKEIEDFIRNGGLMEEKKQGFITIQENTHSSLADMNHFGLLTDNSESGLSKRGYYDNSIMIMERSYISGLMPIKHAQKFADKMHTQTNYLVFIIYPPYNMILQDGDMAYIPVRKHKKESEKEWNMETFINYMMNKEDYEKNIKMTLGVDKMPEKHDLALIMCLDTEWGKAAVKNSKHGKTGFFIDVVDILQSLNLKL